MTQIMQQPIAAPAPVPADPSMAVSIRGLYKRYDDKVAVNGLSLDIPTGSFYGLVGPNGAGKTTTINMMTGMLKPDAGMVLVLGKDVWHDVNAVKREIGLMPQPDQIFDRLTGRQLLVYSGMLRSMPRAEALEAGQRPHARIRPARCGRQTGVRLFGRHDEEDLSGHRDDP